MIKQRLLRWGALCLMALVTCGAGAQKIEERELYSTDFSDWTALDASAAETVVNTANTKYSRETLKVSVYNTNVGPDAEVIIGSSQWSKFSDYPIGGTLQAAKNGGSYIVTSPLASITKVAFVHGATGGNRGWSLWAKGDGDDDWVQITKTVADPASYCEVTADINRTNCQLKFTNIDDAQNAYMFRLSISGNVDLSKYPMLGTFSFNGVTYTAAEIFDEVESGVQEARIEIASDDPVPSESNPITDLTFDNGEQDGAITYTKQEDGSTVVSIKVKAGDQTVTYNAVFALKPKYTLTYYNTDGSVISNDQLVEEDKTIAAFTKGEADVTVPEGMKFRGWFVNSYGGEKYTTDYVVTSDINLYAVATKMEDGTDSRYDFALNDEFFYDEDHEAINGVGAKFHDTAHGWSMGAGDKIELMVGGDATILVQLCKYTGTEAKLQLIGTDGATVVKEVNAYNATDGYTETIEYTGPAGTISLVADGTAYIHHILVMNTGAAPIEKNEQGYYVVNAGDGGHLLNVLDVVNALPADEGRAYIFLPDGVYDLGHEVLTPISRNNVSIIGQSMDGTKIVNEALQEGISVSATFLIKASNTYIQDVTLQNAYDYYKPGFAGRAVVIQDKGQRTICKNVRMLSYQDTYYSNNKSQFYFENSDIHGTVDFICGGGDVFFKNCLLTVEPRTAGGSGECTITAPSTDVAGGNKWGYVFSGCTIDSKAEAFNYGRAWNDSPRCAYLNTTLLQPEKLNANRWTLGGMNVAADKFVEYNTMNAKGDVISPASLVLKFEKNDKVNEYETILTAEQAAEYDIDNVFTNWSPDEDAAQKMLGKLKADGTRLTWDAVDGVTTYAVFRDGKFVAMTSTNAYDITEGDAADYTVRAANAHGGFGRPASTEYTSGIAGVEAAGENVVSTAYYSIDGARVSNACKGIVIKVDTMSDGTVKTTKIVK